MGNTIKLVSGFILFVIGVLIAYETAVYNLIDILLIVGLIISIVGIILMVSYFVESNADKTTNKIKEFLVSGEAGRHSFSFEKDSKGTNSNGPLKVRKEFNDYDDSAYEEMEVGDYPSSDGSYFNDDYDRSSKAVLNVVPQKETEVNFDNQLDFKPYYGKPLKVTRAPKRRQGEYFSDEIPQQTTPMKFKMLWL